MSQAAPNLHPVAPEARLLHLDVLRGLALFGVLLVNLEMFCGADHALEAKLPYPMGWGGQALAFLRSALLEGKAVALLALLFGVGLAIQLENNQKRGLAFSPFALRRAGALALFGLAHSFLLWNGDILLDYALISLLVLPFLRARASRILWAIPLVLGLSLLVAGLLSTFLKGAQAQGQGAFFARQGVMFGYGAGILLLLRHPWWRRKLGLFAPLGRMALSQYLLQSIVCTWIFNGYGLGLYGKVPTNLCVLGGIAGFALQVWSSLAWLDRYPMGPAEWLWRRLSYGAGRPIQGLLPGPNGLEALSPQELP